MLALSLEFPLSSMTCRVLSVFVTNKCFRCKLSKQTQDEILHLPILLRKIEEMIEEEITSLVDTTDILPKHVDCVISKTCLISKLIYWLLKYNVVNCDTLLKMDIVNLLKIAYKVWARYL
jgi:hypothetical protein